MSRLKKYGSLYLKGLAMGAADVVPGVSGGTIAFITNIYQELLDSISAFSRLENYKVLLKSGPVEFFRRVNGLFLVVLFAGVFTSIFSLAKGISYLLDNEPELIWSFFFGLILVSCFLIARQVGQWNIQAYLAVIVGGVIAYGVTVSAPAVVEPSYWKVFAAGAVAICAMILPGISGSFILLILGLYGHIIGAIKDLDVPTLLVFMSGTGIGLLAFSRILSWFYSHYRGVTLALLTGFLVGSLNAVWPWKQVLSYRTNSHGEQVAFLRENVWPTDYLSVTGNDAHLMAGCGLMLLAIILVYGLTLLGEKLGQK
ncbi:MAG: DUF368 domain-containing protein [Gammaproteobacteria bacterium]|nr:MAG: DUF368 domain-containing protein [Gammaproteobacteria bacterium]